MSGLSEERVPLRPSGSRIVRILARSLAGWIRRRPLEEARGGNQLVAHSSEVRQLLVILAGMEIILAFFVSAMIPPVLRPFHVAFEVLPVLTAFGAVAAMVRHPHVVSSSSVVLRTGFSGEVAVPRTSVRSATRTMQTIEGRGLRPVPGEAGAVACSNGSMVGVRIHLDPPTAVDLGEAGVVQASAVYVSADDPGALLRLIDPSQRV
ncbi:hypothetical protein ACFVGY_21705 [Streptomyces sp. NPDC127106]|uniref:hypothetical protein n=1 Tax=Streptomyces sp. NPDC127106 TaxID=3345360 RepID=UPI00363462E7